MALGDIRLQAPSGKVGRVELDDVKTSLEEIRDRLPGSGAPSTPSLPENFFRPGYVVEFVTASAAPGEVAKYRFKVVEVRYPWIQVQDTLIYNNPDPTQVGAGIGGMTFIYIPGFVNGFWRLEAS